LAQNAAVTMDTNTISNVCPDNNNGPGFNGGLRYDSLNIVPRGTTPGPSPVPEPATMLLLGSGLLGFVGLRRKFKN
jgi:hypothetical protein